MSKRVQVEKVIIYPVKSCKGIELTECEVTENGFKLDRKFVIVDKDSKMITGRTFPKTVLIETKIIKQNNDTLIELSYQGFEPLLLTTNIDKIKQLTDKSVVSIWKNEVSSYFMGDEAAQWVSKVLDTDAKIFMKAEDIRQPVDIPLDHLKFVPKFNYADKFPFNFISKGSVESLKNELPTDELKDQVSANNFRPNLVFSGSDPFEEDHWLEIEIGNVKFQGAEPCSRCTFPNVNPDNGIPHPTEPSKTLMKHRRVYPNYSKFKSFIGAHFIQLTKGTIKVGDSVTIYSTEDRQPK